MDREPSPTTANFVITATNGSKPIHNATEAATAKIFAGANDSCSPLDSQQDEGIPWEIQRPGNDVKNLSGANATFDQLPVLQEFINRVANKNKLCYNHVMGICSNKLPYISDHRIHKMSKDTLKKVL